MLRNVVAIGLIALIGSACSTSREASVKAEVRGLTAEVRDSLRVEQVMVAVHDTLTITKTITIRENEQGDTVRMSVVTDRERVRSRADVRSKKEEVRVVRDTVYVAVRDSTDVRSYGATESQSGGTALHRTLKWVLAIAFLLLASVVFVRARH